MNTEDFKTRIVLVGRSRAGKTTLIQYLNNKVIEYKKTQTVQIVNKTMIDTPGEYLERRGFRGALMVTSADAEVMVFVQQATEHGTMFPPGYSSNFPKPCVGIVTKADLATEEEIEQAKKYLEFAGARRIFVTSSYEGTGFDGLLEAIEEEAKNARSHTKRGN